MTSLLDPNHNTPSPSQERPSEQRRTAQKRPAPRGTAAYPRKRAITACQVFRARRTKCDNRKPSCSFCLEVGAKCIQSPVDLSSLDPASLKILERLDGLEQLVLCSQKNVDFSRTSGPPQSKYGSWVQALEPLELDMDRSQMLPQAIKAILKWPCLGLSNLSGIKIQLRRSADLTAAQPVSSPVPLLDKLQPELAKALLDKFFKCVHMKNPVLDKVKARRLVLRLCIHRIDWSPGSCLGLLVCALGLIATPFGHNKTISHDPEAYAIASLFYNAAQKRLGIVLGSKGVLEAQCCFLSGVYMMTMFQRVIAWRFFLLDQKPDIVDADGTEHFQLGESFTREQAIYWFLWKSEQELRLDIPAPDFILSETELAMYPSFSPIPPPPQESGTPGTGDEFEQREHDSWYFYLSDISLRRLSLRIANVILGSQASEEKTFLEAVAKTTSEHEAQAEEWVMTLPLIMSIKSPPEEDDICRFVLQGQLVNLYKMIYWPFVQAAINGPRTSLTSRAGLSPLLQSLARKGLQHHVNRLQVNRPGFQHRHHGTPCLILSCTCSALILMAAATSAQTHIDQGLTPLLRMPQGWKDTVASAIELNCYWESESSDSRHLLLVLKKVFNKVQYFEA